MKRAGRCFALKISLLPEDVFSRIAAGEVVERPVSVVKEAVENSLDAGASEVKVSLFEGGKLRIVVRDDGEGIAFNELPLAVARHATSKIHTLEELERVQSLGFRGEALASIAAVSRFEIHSRRAEDDEGGLLRVESGRTVLHMPIPCLKGTRISVEDLFYPLPARRKFLKTAASEGRRTSSLIRDFAVAYPSVAFFENHDGKNGFSSTGDGDRERVLRDLWGDHGELRSCETKAANLFLECWWMPFPGKTRSSVTTFVNGRTVTDSVIRGAVGSLCRTLIGNWVFLFTLPPVLLDANIHPAKAEVRFRYPGEVFDTVQQAVLKLSGSVPTISPCELTSFSGEKNRPFTSEAVLENNHGERPLCEQSFPFSGESLFCRVAAAPPLSESMEKQPSEDGGSENHIRFLGQIASGYLVFETDDGLAVMDPHAAHERIGYERMGRISRESLVFQRCAIPLPVPPSFSLAVTEHRDDLEKVGFSFEEKEGLLSLMVFPSLPGNMGEDPLRLLRAILLEWTEERKTPLEEILWKKLATMACGMAVKLGDRLTTSESLALWWNLQRCESPWSCPHGRPTVLVLTRRKLETFFGRE